MNTRGLGRSVGPINTKLDQPPGRCRTGQDTLFCKEASVNSTAPLPVPIGGQAISYDIQYAGC